MSRFMAVFCFKQKTAYEMRISDWSSDVCSSDLASDAYFPYLAIAPDVAGARAAARSDRHGERCRACTRAGHGPVRGRLHAGHDRPPCDGDDEERKSAG